MFLQDSDSSVGKWGARSIVGIKKWWTVSSEGLGGRGASHESQGGKGLGAEPRKVEEPGMGAEEEGWGTSQTQRGSGIYLPLGLLCSQLSLLSLWSRIEYPDWGRGGAWSNTSWGTEGPTQIGPVEKSKVTAT